MTIGILKEKNDPRVVFVPEHLPKIKEQLGVDVLVENGAGEGAFCSDADYSAQATVTDRKKILADADMIVSIDPLPENEWSALKKSCVLISRFQPFHDKEIEDKLKKAGFTAYSLDMVPRITLAQSMDVLSSMASIAGYKAVLMAANQLPRYFPMLITAAGSIRPAKVLVLGAGVAGLQAIATAKRLGAMVEAFDTRSAAKQEVESLGGRFIEVEGAAEDTDAGGYAVAQSEEFLKRQQAEVQARAAKSDVIITTAQVRGRKAPILVPTSTLDNMRPGSIVVDLAASTGGNCEKTKDREQVVYKGVTIIGDSDLAATMPQDASFLFGNNVLNFLKLMIKEGKYDPPSEDEILDGARITPKLVKEEG